MEISAAIDKSACKAYLQKEATRVEGPFYFPKDYHPKALPWDENQEKI